MMMSESGRQEKECNTIIVSLCSGPTRRQSHITARAILRKTACDTACNTACVTAQNYAGQYTVIPDVITYDCMLRRPRLVLEDFNFWHTYDQTRTFGDIGILHWSDSSICFFCIKCI